MNETELRALLTTAAVFVAVGLLVAAVVEMTRSTRRIELVVTRADLAANQVYDVLQSARDITRRAAEGLDD